MRITLLFLIVCFELISLSAQPTVPNTPTASMSSYSKFAEIEPNLYNGATTVPIPITTVSEGPISIPIGISYHTAGIRAHELSSTIGLGWSLQAGGAITRRVRGLADETDDGWLQTGGSAQSYTGGTGTYDVQYRDDLENGNVDGETDIYYFQVGGISGQFAFDHHGNIHTIPESDFLITHTELPNTEVMNFKIVTTDGMQYFFGPIDQYNVDDHREITETRSDEYTSTWFLRQISTHDNLHSLHLSYDLDRYSYFSLQDCSFFGNDTDCEMQAVQVDVQTQNISSISSSTSTIHFDYVEDRQDLMPYQINIGAYDIPDRLYQIRDIEGGKTVTHAFTQSYFSDTEDTPNHLGLSSSEETVSKKRLKLDAIHVSGGSEVMPPYSFNYYDQNGNTNGSFFPSQVTQAIDHWGYYNGAHSNNDYDFIIPQSTATCGTNTQVRGNTLVSRAVHPQNSLAGNLSTITYPLGGTTSFSYETNEYWNPESQTVITGEQVHENINCGSSNMTSTQTSVYINEDAYYHGEAVVEISSPCGSGVAALTIIGPGVNYVISALGNNATNRKRLYNIPNMQANKSYTFKLDVLRGTGKSYVEYSYNGTNEPCGGLRLASINTTDNNGTNIDRSFDYSIHDESNQSSGVLFRFPKYGLFHGAGCNGFWAWSTHSVVGLQSFEGYHVGYSSAGVDYNGNGAKRIDFYNDFAPVPEYEYPPVPENDREFVGQPKSTSLLNEAGDTLSYNEQILRSGYNSTIGSQQVSAAAAANGIVTKIYNIHNGIYLPAQSIAVNEGIKTTTDFLYATGLQYAPIETTVKDENGNRLSQSTTQYTTIYTGDNQSSVQSYFDAKNIKQAWKSDSWTNGVGNLSTDTKTHYNLFSGIPRPDYRELTTKRLLNGAPQSNTDITDFKSYDTKGNLTALRYEGDLLDHSYEYYPNSLLKKSCFGSLCTTYEYASTNSSRLLTKKIAVDGTTMSYLYDGLKRLSQSKDDQTLASTDITYHLSNSDKSYTKTIESYQADPLGLSSLTSRETRSFVDGLGRPIQTVGVNQAFGGGDQITAQSYDDQGRIQYQYETIEASNNNGAYVTPQTSWKKTENQYEPSPLNRITKTTPPEWYDTELSYGTNTTDDFVKDYHSAATYYPAGTLFRRQTTDANLNQSISYTDVRGRNILNRRADVVGNQAHDTYYIYDDKNQLVQVIPPGSTLDDPELNYYYQYDAEGKTIAKKVPSKGWIYYVFNDRDLLLAQQDSFLRAKDQWYAYRYDVYNREIENGFYNGANPPTSDLPSLPAGLMSQTVYSAVSGITLGKVAQTWTKDLSTNEFLRSVPNYDNAGRIDYIVSDNHLALANGLTLTDSTLYHYDGASNIVKTRNRIVDHNDDITIIEDYQTIDDDGRTTAQYLSLNGVTQQLNELSYTPKDEIATKYVGGNLNAHLQQTDYSYLDNGMLRSINNGSISGSDLYAYEINYDTQPSVTSTSSASPVVQYNGNISSIQWSLIGEPVQLNHYRYDHLNRLTHSYTQSDLYNTEYSYDQRGNFNSIKRYADIDGVATAIDDLSPDYDPHNANQMIRMNETALSDKGYKSNASGDYAYDGNGNMISDPEKGITMSYNHLDLVDTISWDDGRRIVMSYTANGSLLNRSMYSNGDTLIRSHDYLAQMEYMDGYKYSISHAEGRIVNEGLEQYLKYLYLDHQQHNDGLFSAEQIESEGQIIEQQTSYIGSDQIVLSPGFTVDSMATFTANILPPDPYQEQWRFEWDIRDHLGSLRMVYADLNSDGVVQDTEVIHQQNLYPYGLSYDKTTTNSLESTYQYNGIELVKEFGLGWHMATYRSLVTEIPIWNSVDPMSEYLYGYSPYVAMNNNPITFNDPDGDIAPLVMAGIGIVGGGLNVWRNWDHIQNGGGWSAGLKAFGVGATAAVVGTVAAPAAGVGATFGATVGSFATAGAVGGAVGGAIEGFGNSLFFSDGDFMDHMAQGITHSVVGAFGGAALGAGMGAGAHWLSKLPGPVKPPNIGKESEEVFEEFIDPFSVQSVTGGGATKITGGAIDDIGYSAGFTEDLVITSSKGGNLISDWKIGGSIYRFNRSHAYSRSHIRPNSGGQSTRLSDTGLTANEIERGIIQDLQGRSLPNISTSRFTGNVVLNSNRIVYKAGVDNNNIIRINNYFIE